MSRVFFVTGLALFLILISTPKQATAQFGGGGEGYGRGGYGGEGGYEGEYGGSYGGRRLQPVERKKSISTTISGSETQKHFEDALNQTLKSPLQYEEQPLNEVIQALSEEYEIPILFDLAALDEVAVSPDTEVTFNLRGLSLRSALNLILRQPGLEDLTYIIDEEVLLITTKENANTKLVVQIYRVDD